MKKILITLILVFMASTAMSATVPEVTYVWTAPTTGSAVDHYVVQLKVGELDWIQFEGTELVGYTFENLFEYDQTYIVRVAGVDVQSRQGLWSDQSIPYTPDAGAPGIPGAPIFIDVP